MGGESTFHAFQCTYSTDRHVEATEYEEIIAFCKRWGYYYAVKAEDTHGDAVLMPADAPGKVHIHFMFVREFAKYSHDTSDKRYGAIRKSHIREHFIKECPGVATAIATSQYHQKFALAMCPLDSDKVIAYYQKESILKSYNLPDDCVVLRPYMSVKEVKVKNHLDEELADAYVKAGEPIPATYESVWKHLNHRWFVLNDLERLKQEVLQVAMTKRLVASVNGEAMELPKALGKRKAPFTDQCYCYGCHDLHDARYPCCPECLDAHYKRAINNPYYEWKS